MAVFVLGDKYVVVDSGGGTVDLTVHQIRLPEGHLKELYKATGEPEEMRKMANLVTRELFSSLQISLSSLSFQRHQQVGLFVGKRGYRCVKPESKMHLNVLSNTNHHRAGFGCKGSLFQILAKGSCF